MSRPLWYPTVDDVVEIHDDIVSEYAETTRGVQSEGISSSRWSISKREASAKHRRHRRPYTRKRTIYSDSSSPTIHSSTEINEPR